MRFETTDYNHLLLEPRYSSRNIQHRPPPAPFHPTHPLSVPPSAFSRFSIVTSIRPSTPSSAKILPQHLPRQRLHPSPPTSPTSPSSDAAAASARLAMPVLSRPEQEALVSAIDSNDALKVARLCATPELAHTVQELVRCLAVLKDDARYSDPPGITMRDFLTTCNGWPPAPTAPRPSKAAKMDAIRIMLRALDDVFDNDKKRKAIEYASASSSSVASKTEHEDAPLQDDERRRQKSRLELASPASSAAASPLLIRSPSPAPPPMHIDATLGARLGRTLCYSSDYLTPTQLHRLADDTQRANVVVRILKTSTSAAAAAAHYRIVHVDVGDGATTTLRAYRGSPLFERHTLQPGDIVELRRIGVLTVNKRDAIRCDQHSSHCRFPDEIKPAWDEVLQWHAWIDTHRN